MKQININNRAYYFFNDLGNIKDSSLLKINKKSYQNVDICHIGYITMNSISDYEKINSVQTLYLIIGEVYEYIEESNGNKYLTFASYRQK